MEHHLNCVIRACSRQDEKFTKTGGSQLGGRGIQACQTNAAELGMYILESWLFRPWAMDNSNLVHFFVLGFTASQDYFSNFELSQSVG